MADKSGSKLCVVCSKCPGTGGDGGDLGGDFLSHPQFSQFCGELEICAEDFNDELDKQDNFVADGFLGNLNKCRDKVCVCSNCLSMISRAVDKKLKMDEVEQNVVKMQVELLRKLEVLKECTDLYWREMEGLLRRVNQSEVDCFEKKLMGDVLIFKERIIDVVTAMGIFRGEMESKLLQKPSKAEIQEDSIGMDDALATNSPIAMDYEDDSFQDFEDLDNIDDDDDDTIAKIAKNDNANVRKEETVLELERKETSSSDKKTPELEMIVKEEPEMDTSDEEFEETKSPPKTPTKRKKSTKIRIRKKKHYLPDRYNLKLPIFQQVDFSKMGPSKTNLICRILNPSPSQLNHPDQLDDNLEWKYDIARDQITVADIPISITEDIKEGSTVTLQCQHTSSPCTYSINFQLTSKSKLIAMQKRLYDHVISTHTTKFHCSKCTHKASTLVSYNAHVIRHPDPDHHKSSSDSFKSQFILRISQGSIQKVKIDHPDQLHYSIHWKYDPVEDQITIANVPISLSEEIDKITLHCHHPDCNFTLSFNPTLKSKPVSISMQNRLFDHVLISHTNLYHCSKCTHKATTLLAFNAHVIHHQNPDRLKCPKCGMLFLMQCNVTRHIKSCTKNAGTSKEASETSPTGYQVITKLEQCKVCGQKCERGYGFRKHMETHLKREDRPKVTCPLCGMTVLKLHYAQHKRLRCPKRESKQVLQCDVCGKTFKSPHPSYLKEHKARAHGIKETNYLCGTCGAGYLFAKDLRAHRKSAHGEEPEEWTKEGKRMELECRKGCGKVFYRERNRDVHEAMRCKRKKD